MNTVRRNIKAALRATTATLFAIRGAAGADSITVVVRTVESEPRAGRVASFSLTGGLMLIEDGGAEELTIATEDIVEISVASEESAPGDDPIQTIRGAECVIGPAWPDGKDRIVGDVRSFENDRVKIETRWAGIVQVPLELIATWRNTHDGEATDESAIERFWHEVTQGQDRLLMTNGDQIAGVITAADADGFTLESSGTQIHAPHARVAAAAIIPAPNDAGDGVLATLELSDGSRLTTRELQWDTDNITATAFDGERIAASLKHVHKISIRGGRWVWLTNLRPVSVEQTPMMSIDWPFMISRNVLGGPLACEGRRFDNGIGVHSRSVLNYELAGGYESFVVSYGMDDDSGPQADVSIEIRVDGELRHANDSVRRGVHAGPVRLNVGGAGRVELIVGFGRFGGVQDRFNWLEAGLVR